MYSEFKAQNSSTFRGAQQELNDHTTFFPEFKSLATDGFNNLVAEDQLHRTWQWSTEASELMRVCTVSSVRHTSIAPGKPFDHNFC